MSATIWQRPQNRLKLFFATAASNIVYLFILFLLPTTDHSITLNVSECRTSYSCFISHFVYSRQSVAGSSDHARNISISRHRKTAKGKNSGGGYPRSRCRGAMFLTLAILASSTERRLGKRRRKLQSRLQTNRCRPPETARAKLRAWPCT